MEDQLVYKSTCVDTHKGSIVDTRALSTAGRTKVEDKTPNYIADKQLCDDEDLMSIAKKLLIIR